MIVWQIIFFECGCRLSGLFSSYVTSTLRLILNYTISLGSRTLFQGIDTAPYSLGQTSFSDSFGFFLHPSYRIWKMQYGSILMTCFKTLHFSPLSPLDYVILRFYCTDLWYKRRGYTVLLWEVVFFPVFSHLIFKQTFLQDMDNKTLINSDYSTSCNHDAGELWLT